LGRRARFSGRKSRSRLREDGLVPETLDLAEFRAFIVAEIAHWKPMLRETGFAAQ
jgi:tripartite-type tricarboxylate transporter receptor subunit TctC